VVHDASDDTTPVDLELSVVLGKLPQKTFHVQSVPPVARALALPAQLPVAAALDRVLRLVSVGSKRFLTNKVDRSVTGLIAQQQCVGPLHIPISDVAVVAQVSCPHLRMRVVLTRIFCPHAGMRSVLSGSDGCSHFDWGAAAQRSH